MSVSNITTATPKTIAICKNHTNGDGIKCEWRTDPEIDHCSNTLTPNATITNP